MVWLYDLARYCMTLSNLFSFITLCRSIAHKGIHYIWSQAGNKTSRAKLQSVHCSYHMRHLIVVQRASYCMG
jgi:hypothetical protein